MNSEEPENLVFFYHPDHLGSTSYVTDANGNIAQHIEYIPHGEVFVEERNSQFSTNFLFNAKELDNETGLYYYGARYQDPTGAMWLSVDPLFEKYAGMSPYNYCAGNPVMMVDPTGREVEDVEDLIKTFERFSGELTTCAEPTQLTENYSSRNETPMPIYRRIYGKNIPVGEKYRNAKTGGCPAATLCSIFDMFELESNSYNRTQLDIDRQNPRFGAKLNEYFDSFEVTDDINMAVLSRKHAISQMNKMKEEGFVFAMTYNEIYQDNGEWKNYPHTVIITGFSGGSKKYIHYWDNQSGTNKKMRSDNGQILNFFRFESSHDFNPWNPIDIDIFSIQPSYIFAK